MLYICNINIYIYIIFCWYKCSNNILKNLNFLNFIIFKILKYYLIINKNIIIILL